MNIIEILVSASKAASALMAIATFALFTVKPFRQWFLGIKEHKQKIASQEATEYESVKCLLRSEIVRIYYANRGKCSLHSFEYENIAKLYTAYKEMGGNSFVDRIWEEIQEWEIIP